MFKKINAYCKFGHTGKVRIENIKYMGKLLENKTHYETFKIHIYKTPVNMAWRMGRDIKNSIAVSFECYIWNGIDEFSVICGNKNMSFI